MYGAKPSGMSTDNYQVLMRLEHQRQALKEKNFLEAAKNLSRGSNTSLLLVRMEYIISLRLRHLLSYQMYTHIDPEGGHDAYATILWQILGKHIERGNEEYWKYAFENQHDVVAMLTESMRVTITTGCRDATAAKLYKITEKLHAMMGKYGSDFVGKDAYKLWVSQYQARSDIDRRFTLYEWVQPVLAEVYDSMPYLTEEERVLPCPYDSSGMTDGMLYLFGCMLILRRLRQYTQGLCSPNVGMVHRVSLYCVLHVILSGIADTVVTDHPAVDNMYTLEKEWDTVRDVITHYTSHIRLAELDREYEGYHRYDVWHEEQLAKESKKKGNVLL